MRCVKYLSFGQATERIRLDLETTTVELLRGFGEVIGVSEKEKRQCDGVLELAASGFVKKATGRVTHMCTRSFQKKRTHQFFRCVLIRCNPSYIFFKYFLHQQRVAQTVYISLY